MPNYTPEQLNTWTEMIKQGKYPYQDRHSSRECDLTGETLIDIYKNSPEVGEELTYIHNLPEEVLEFLANDAKDFVRAGVARHPYCSIAILRKLVKDQDSLVRSYVAANPNADSGIFDQIVKDLEPEVALQLLVNERTDVSYWKAIVEDQLLFEHAFNDQYPNPTLFVANIPESLIEEIKEKLSSERRHHLLSSIYFKEAWVDELISDPKSNKNEIARRLIHRNEMTSERIPAFLKGTEAEVRVKIAELPHLDNEIQKKLAKDKSALVREALVKNPIADPEILTSLLEDKSVWVLDALKNEFYYDRNTDFKKTYYVGREALIAAANGKAADLGKKNKATSVQGRIEQLLDWEIKESDFETLKADKSIGIRTAAHMRAAELGLISFKEAVSFIEEFAPQTSQAKNQWLGHRMESFRNTKNEAFLDLIISLKGDQELANLVLDKNFEMSENLFMKILKAHFPFTNWQIAISRELTADMLDELAQTPSWSYDLFGQAAPELVFGQWEVETNNGYRVASHPQAIAARHPLTRPETLTKLKTARSKYVRGVMLERPEFSSPEDLVKASKDKDAYVRSLVAAHSNVTAETLEKLASDKDPEVRKVAAANPNATPEIKAAVALLNLAEK